MYPQADLMTVVWTSQCLSHSDQVRHKPNSGLSNSIHSVA